MSASLTHAHETRRLRTTVVAVLTVLALGVAGHLWHHLTDPACELPQGGSAHPCAMCVGLHASALAEQTQAGPSLAVAPSAFIFLPATLAHSAEAPRVAPARGPPPV